MNRLNRLQQAFAKGKAFIPFITAGDPSLEITEQLVLEMAKAGADIIELGIPFSDPVAEGQVIQAASSRALADGVTVDKVFAMLKSLRRTCQVPIAFMTYANPIFAYGAARFMENCREALVDGLIVPDLPFEEHEELLPFCLPHGISLISMIAPTSKDRIRMIAREAQGFIYCVSSLGVTGVREHIGNEAEEMVKTVKEVKDIPCAVGFGVSTPEQASRLAEYADGIIVGSAIVQMVEQYGLNCVPYVADYVRTMKRAITGDRT